MKKCQKTLSSLLPYNSAGSSPLDPVLVLKCSPGINFLIEALFRKLFREARLTKKMDIFVFLKNSSSYQNSNLAKFQGLEGNEQGVHISVWAQKKCFRKINKYFFHKSSFPGKYSHFDLIAC